MQQSRFPQNFTAFAPVVSFRNRLALTYWKGVALQMVTGLNPCQWHRPVSVNAALHLWGGHYVQPEVASPIPYCCRFC